MCTCVLIYAILDLWSKAEKSRRECVREREGGAMDDEERLEGEEEMELDEASDGEDEDEEATGISVSPANSDQLLGQTTPTTPGNDL